MTQLLPQINVQSEFNSTMLKGKFIYLFIIIIIIIIIIFFHLLLSNINKVKLRCSSLGKVY
jgi:hypothetical protein